MDSRVPSGNQPPEYPWVQAMERARRLLWRLKVGVAAMGTFALGLIVALAAGQTATASSPPPSASQAAPATDVFGQGTQPGPDNQPGSIDPGTGGQAPAQQAPEIVTAPS